MSGHAQASPSPRHAGAYWERRARRFASRGDGLAAVCAYGMPEFYNRMIQWTQRRALEPWLAVRAGMRVLDVGCGVGRWGRTLAARGAHVTGVDLSATMIAEARRRAHRSGLSQHCRFLVQDLAELDTGETYELIVGVTVLQHVLEPRRLRAALERMAAHLAPGGRMVLLEAAPLRANTRCNTAMFTARERSGYLQLFAQCQLTLQAVAGVDPAPFKLWLLPHLRHLPRAAGALATALVSALSVPVDGLLAARLPDRSWHAVFVLGYAPLRLAPASTP
jgi:2-polyprenyl-3-methyl-5-hydroxy-6-metoxy-1,4-benzoquinol methylase